MSSPLCNCRQLKMAERRDSKSRDHYKQSVVLQRAEGSDVTDRQMLRRRSLTIAHLYLSSASLARTRTHHLSQNESVHTSQDSHSDAEKVLGSFRERPKSAYPFERPEEEPPSDVPPKPELPMERPKREHKEPQERVATVRPRPRLTLERPKSEHYPRRAVLEYRDVILRDSDQKRVVPRLSRTERRHPSGDRDSDVSDASSKLKSSFQRKP